MERTRHRPLPSGRLRPIEALIFGVVTAVAGIFYLWVEVNPLSAIVTGTIAALYLGAYTPMKRITWLCHVIGAVPGALPPVIGWAAARNGVGGEPLVLFAIMFLWQLPHSLSIARLYQRDYARAGIRMLPQPGRYGDPANSLMIAAAAALLVVGMLPALMRFAGLFYVPVALVLGALLLFHCLRLVLGRPTIAAAQYMLKAYTYYKPLQPLHVIATIGLLIIIAGQIPFLVNFFVSMFRGKRAEANPWHANTLEWATDSPPPHENFHTIPTVVRGPYDYSVPGMEQDWAPQNAELLAAAARN